MKIKKFYFFVLFILVLGLMFLNGCKPVRNLTSMPKPWTGDSNVMTIFPKYDPAKKNVVVIADSRLTEIFDMLAPYYLFNSTGMANVFIAAKDKTPILIKKDLFLCPQLTFRQADSMHLVADVIVIPAMSIRDENQDSVVISWIKHHFTDHTKVLTICDGASTGAATGLYDGKSITCHATDFNMIKPHFKNPIWVRNVSVAKSGNLFSTAGVSNAVEGSLTVIEELFGAEISKKVAVDIHYPHQEVKLSHNSIVLSGGNKWAVAKKILFRKNKDIGVLLANGINEFEMAGFIDTYGRTFPRTFKAFVVNDSIIHTKHGLTLISRCNNSIRGLDELHVIMPETFSATDQSFFKKTKIIMHDNLAREYQFDFYLKKIKDEYGSEFEKFVKVSLDYN